MKTTIDEDATTHAAAERIGPYYSITSLSDAMRITEDEVSLMARDGLLLRLHTSDNVALFPAWQLDDGKKSYPYIIHIARVLSKADVDPWAIADWLCNPYSKEDPTLIHEYLAKGENVDEIRERAKEFVARANQK